jgi:hypothetical protein
VEEDPRVTPSEHATERGPAAKPDLRSGRTHRSFLPDVTGVDFPLSRRGYDRNRVDQYIERVSRIVVELEASRSPDAAIERALADVGEETSAILRRARGAAEDILAEAMAEAQQLAARAQAEAQQTRAEADRHREQGRADAENIRAESNSEAAQRAAEMEAEAQRAREETDRYRERVKGEAENVLAEAHQEAEQLLARAAADGQRTREEADRYREEGRAHTEQLVQERLELIEDLHKLADQFHRAADVALDHIQRAEESVEDEDRAAGRSLTELPGFVDDRTPRVPQHERRD